MEPTRQNIERLLDLLAVPMQMGGSLYDWAVCRACDACSDVYGTDADIDHTRDCPVGNR